MIAANAAMGMSGLEPLQAQDAQATSEAAGPQAFGDFTALRSAEGAIGIGRATASADAAHAARAVAAFLVEA